MRHHRNINEWWIGLNIKYYLAGSYRTRHHIQHIKKSKSNSWIDDIIWTRIEESEWKKKLFYRWIVILLQIEWNVVYVCVCVCECAVCVFLFYYINWILKEEVTGHLFWDVSLIQYKCITIYKRKIQVYVWKKKVSYKFDFFSLLHYLLWNCGWNYRIVGCEIEIKRK